MAEAVGFEPTGDFTRHSISSRDRYDHFDTPPYGWQQMILYHISLKNARTFLKNLSKIYSSVFLPKSNDLFRQNSFFSYPESADIHKKFIHN